MPPSILHRCRFSSHILRISHAAILFVSSRCVSSSRPARLRFTYLVRPAPARNPVMALRTIASTLLLASLISRTSAQRNCWFPDGSTETKDIPCDPNAQESACCGENAFCLRNGLCYTGGVVSRGSCTDRDWGSAACARQCATGMSNPGSTFMWSQSARTAKVVADTFQTVNTSAGVVLINCDFDTSSWVCAAGGATCGDGDSQFTIDSTDLNTLALRPLGSGGSPIMLDPQTSLGDATASNDSSTSIVTVTAIPTSTASASGFSTGQMAGVGAGVGIPLVIALAAAVVIILMQRKRLRAAESHSWETTELNGTSQSSGGEYAQGSMYAKHAPPSPDAAYGQSQPVVEMDAQRAGTPGIPELPVPKD